MQLPINSKINVPLSSKGLMNWFRHNVAMAVQSDAPAARSTCCGGDRAGNGCRHCLDSMQLFRRGLDD